MCPEITAQICRAGLQPASDPGAQLSPFSQGGFSLGHMKLVAQPHERERKLSVCWVGGSTGGSREDGLCDVVERAFTGRGTRNHQAPYELSVLMRALSFPFCEKIGSNS